MNLEELEEAMPNLDTNNVNVKKDKSAFNIFLKTMKDAGQLPEKPSPVVSYFVRKENFKCIPVFKIYMFIKRAVMGDEYFLKNTD